MAELKHQAVLKNVVDKLTSDSGVQSIVVFGSVSQEEESARSDIDLWVIRDTDDFTRRHIVREGITLEMWEGPREFTEFLLEQGDPPVIRILTEGRVLLDRGGSAAALVPRAREKYAAGPPPESDQHLMTDRSMLTHNARRRL